jgi:hypothetical protein
MYVCEIGYETVLGSGCEEYTWKEDLCQEVEVPISCQWTHLRLLGMSLST